MATCTSLSQYINYLNLLGTISNNTFGGQVARYYGVRSSEVQQRYANVTPEKFSGLYVQWFPHSHTTHCVVPNNIVSKTTQWLNRGLCPIIISTGNCNCFYFIVGSVSAINQPYEHFIGDIISLSYLSCVDADIYSRGAVCGRINLDGRIVDPMQLVAERLTPLEAMRFRHASWSCFSRAAAYYNTPDNFEHVILQSNCEWMLTVSPNEDDFNFISSVAGLFTSYTAIKQLCSSVNVDSDCGDNSKGGGGGGDPYSNESGGGKPPKPDSVHSMTQEEKNQFATGSQQCIGCGSCKRVPDRGTGIFRDDGQDDDCDDEPAKHS